MNLLLCDGAANGEWYRSPAPVAVGDIIKYMGDTYIVIEWPSGELVGAWNNNPE